MSVSNKGRYDVGDLVAVPIGKAANPEPRYLNGVVTRVDDKYAYVRLVINNLERKFFHSDLFFLNKPKSPAV